MAALYLNFNRVCVLLVSNGDKVDYIQYLKGKVQLLSMPADKFHTEFRLSTDARPPATIAQSMLNLANNGAAITPAVRLALEQVISQPHHTEADMAVPTTIKTSKKIIAKTDKPSKTKKLSEVIEENDTPLFNIVGGRAVSNTPDVVEMNKLAAVITESSTAAAEQVTGSSELTMQEQAAQIVASAQEEASKALAEVRQMLEDAKRKAEEKKLLERARADAKKITDATKAEIEKLKKQIKALSGGKAARGSKKSDGEVAQKGTRTKLDLSGKKIKLIEAPTTRENSARGALIAAVCECKTVDEAMEFEGVTYGFVQKLVDKGNIELV